MKVALVHDDLIQWGGAERVLLALSEIFPEAPIFTSLFNDSNRNLREHFGGKKVVTSFMQKIPGAKGMHKALLPLYPMAFEQFDFSGFDLVISQTTRFAKSIITKPTTRHICYCHTPPRFLWNFSGEKVPKALSLYISFLKLYDQISSSRVDQFLAGSENARARIKKVYQMDSKVLYPFVDIDQIRPEEAFDGGYYLIVARLNKYKRVDLAVEEFSRNGLRLKIIGVGPDLTKLMRKAPANVEFLGSVSEMVLRSQLLGCRALIVTAEEDFGMSALEAQSAGKPVIAYAKGGNLETVIDGETGIFFDDQSVEALDVAIRKLEKTRINPDRCRENAEHFSRAVFEKRLAELVKN